MADFRILPMRRVDLDVVSAIANKTFTVPWNHEAFAAELARPYALLRVLRPGHGEPICAFIHLWCVAGEAQIMNLATLPGFRGRGFACALMEEGLVSARDANCRVMLLEVRRSNLPAISLYERFGFTTVGVRPKYYSDNHEDALVMRRDL